MIRVPENTHPLVAEFIGELNRRGATYRDISPISGVGVDTLRFWPTRHTPRLDTFEAALNSVGMELSIQHTSTRVSASQIIRDVAKAHRVSVDDIKGKSRAPRMVAARVEIAGRLTSECDMTSGQIAHRIGRTAWTVRYYLDPVFRKKKSARSVSRWRVLHEQRRVRIMDKRTCQSPATPNQD